MSPEQSNPPSALLSPPHTYGQPSCASAAATTAPPASRPRTSAEPEARCRGGLREAEPCAGSRLGRVPRATRTRTASRRGVARAALEGDRFELAARVARTRARLPRATPPPSRASWQASRRRRRQRRSGPRARSPRPARRHRPSRARARRAAVPCPARSPRSGDEREHEQQRDRRDRDRAALAARAHACEASG